MTAQLIAAMEKAIHEINKWPEKSVQLFHHNDSDGLTSGAILTRTFERKGFKVKRFCLEKPYPSVLKRVFAQEGKLIVLTDFALFAKTMDPANRDLAYIATIGAVGDHFFLDGRLATQNRAVALETQQQGLLEIREHDAGETYILLTPKGPVPCDELGFYLDTLGAAGYYQKGPDMGIKVCLEGTTPESDRMLEQLRDIQTKIFEDQIKRIRQGDIKQTEHIQWFHVQERFDPMGVKMIGAFCDAYKDTEGFDDHKYIAGFQVIPNKIPGFGPITFDEVKISMRAPVFVQDEIRAGRIPGLDTFLPEATGNLGGFSDACHSLTAATTLDIGKEEALIAEMEKILSR
jgi:hypothetical protein